MAAADSWNEMVEVGGAQQYAYSSHHVVLNDKWQVVKNICMSWLFHLWPMLPRPTLWQHDSTTVELTAAVRARHDTIMMK